MPFPKIRAFLTRTDTDTISVLILFLCLWFPRKVFLLFKNTLCQINNTCK